MVLAYQSVLYSNIIGLLYPLGFVLILVEIVSKDIKNWSTVQMS